MALPVSAEQAWRWHCNPGAFERLVPPWEQITVRERQGSVADGGRAVLRMRRGPIGIRWIADHVDIEPGRAFTDVQSGGPFRSWRHDHRFEPVPGGGSMLVDDLAYELPLGRLGEWAGGAYVRGALDRTFAWRHRRTLGDLSRHAPYLTEAAMRVAITGASGLIGRALVEFLRAGGHEVLPLVRGGGDGIAWDPAAGTIDAGRLDGVDAIVHLAGEPVAGRRWSEAHKAAVLQSRIEGTTLIARTAAGLSRPPAVLVSASAVGFYGDRGDEAITEQSGPGEGFLAEVCRRWEESTAPAELAGIRVVHARIGVVLSARGGALAKMLTPFKLGLGAIVGGGRAHVPWIGFDDTIAALHHTIRSPGLRGPVNLAAPGAATHAELARTLGRVLKRPVLARVPKVMVRPLFGELGPEALLRGARVVPEALLRDGFQFQHPEIEQALRHELGR